jgi:hypothetical protein
MIGRMLPDGDRDGEHEGNQNHSIRNLQTRGACRHRELQRIDTFHCQRVPAEPKCRKQPFLDAITGWNWSHRCAD